MLTKQPRVKPLRLLLLFGIVYLGMVVLALLVFAFAMAMPTLNAVGWHLRNGNTFNLEGHSFHVPLTWNCTLTHYKEWDFSKDHPFSGGFSSVTLSSTGIVQDAATIQRSIERQISSTPKLPSLSTTSIEIIQGRKLRFVCMRLDMRQFGETLFCRIPDTDIDVNVAASASYEAEARSILETSN